MLTKTYTKFLEMCGFNVFGIPFLRFRYYFAGLFYYSHTANTVIQSYRYCVSKRIVSHIFRKKVEKLLKPFFDFNFPDLVGPSAKLILYSIVKTKYFLGADLLFLINNLNNWNCNLFVIILFHNNMVLYNYFWYSEVLLFCCFWIFFVFQIQLYLSFGYITGRKFSIKKYKENMWEKNGKLVFFCCCCSFCSLFCVCFFFKYNFLKLICFLVFLALLQNCFLLIFILQFFISVTVFIT